MHRPGLHWQLERLFRKWDQLGLLSFSDDSYESWQKVRGFNARKSEACDRQIGDRRSLNLLERRLPGPSAELPSGPSLCSFVMRPKSLLCGAVTDRRDFYHQIMVSREKAAGNPVGPAMPVSIASSYAAGRDLSCSKSSKEREAAGDELFRISRQLPRGKRKEKAEEDHTVQPCFS